MRTLRDVAVREPVVGRVGHSERGAALVALTMLATAAVIAGCDAGRVVSPAAAPAPPPGLHPDYSLTERAYFADIAAAAGRPDSVRRYLDTLVHKWRGELRIGVTGSVTAEDTAFVRAVCAQLDAVVGGPVHVAFDTTGRRNVQIHIAPPDSINRALRAQGLYTTIGAAFTADSFDTAGYVVSASVTMDGAYSGDERRRVIRHELMHVLGFQFHSHLVPGSLLYDTYDLNPQYLDVDVSAIEMLYREEVRAGMTGAAALRVLGDLQHRS